MALSIGPDLPHESQPLFRLRQWRCRPLPEKPRFANGSERQVQQALVAQLQDKDVIIVGQRVTDHRKDHEIDFVVAIEGAGIVCVEVKGGDVWHDGTGWWQRRGGKEYRPVIRPG